jgi:protein-S-isoprenylcysteine O-methyltransferase Ste14
LVSKQLFSSLVSLRETKEEQKVVKTGPYALFPHPIFLGEWLLIFGCFLLTSQVSLLVSLSIAFLSDIFAAKGEEKDLKARFGEEYRAYRSQFSFSTYKRDE